MAGRDVRTTGTGSKQFVDSLPGHDSPLAEERYERVKAYGRQKMGEIRMEIEVGL
ncbi:hypothetical protein ACHAP8_003691 [Fusarium lateritium]